MDFDAAEDRTDSNGIERLAHQPAPLKSVGVSHEATKLAQNTSLTLVNDIVVHSSSLKRSPFSFGQDSGLTHRLPPAQPTGATTTTFGSAAQYDWVAGLLQRSGAWVHTPAHTPPPRFIRRTTSCSLTQIDHLIPGHGRLALLSRKEFATKTAV